jgi:aryl-alcohol dehydrogenase-like predicted oxidoreductase
MYGPADEKVSIATIHAALDGGIILFDSGDFYPHKRPRERTPWETLRSLAAETTSAPRNWRLPGFLAKGANIVPVVGARTPRQLAESLAALPVSLSPADLAQIEEAVPPSGVAGGRYAPPQMQMLDSEL